MPVFENWPPTDGEAFIYSDEFGQILLELAQLLAARYPGMDFSDAASQTLLMAKNSRPLGRLKPI